MANNNCDFCGDTVDPNRDSCLLRENDGTMTIVAYTADPYCVGSLEDVKYYPYCGRKLEEEK